MTSCLFAENIKLENMWWTKLEIRSQVLILKTYAISSKLSPVGVKTISDCISPVNVEPLSCQCSKKIDLQ